MWGGESPSTGSQVLNLPFGQSTANSVSEPELTMICCGFAAGTFARSQLSAALLAYATWHRIPTLRWDCGYRLLKRLRLKAPELAQFWD